MQIQSLFINLPVLDVAQTRKFWTALGFTFDERFSDDKAICMVLQPNRIFAMFISHQMFATFTNRAIADGSTTQVLHAISVADKHTVDSLVAAALANGATRYRQPADHGWMYYDTFTCIDGHQWEVMCIQQQV